MDEISEDSSYLLDVGFIGRVEHNMFWEYNKQIGLLLIHPILIMKNLRNRVSERVY